MDLSQNFQKLADDVQKLQTRPTDAELLQLYGLYKQATVGDNATDAPPVWNFKAKAKWSAWMERKGMSTEQAMADYVTFASALIQKYGRSA